MTYTETGPHGWKHFVSAFAERCHGFLAEIGREEMILERERFDEQIQSDAEAEHRSPRKRTTANNFSSDTAP